MRICQRKWDSSQVPPSLAPLHVVDDDSDNRRPAGQERAEHRCHANNADEQAESMERVDRLGLGDQGLFAG